MKFKYLITAFFMILPFASFALELDIVEDKIIFNEAGDPVEINVLLLNNGKIIRWNSDKTLKISSKIKIVDIEGNSLGYNEKSDIKFIPMGVSYDKKYYKLVGVINRNIKNKLKVDAQIIIENENIKPDYFSIIISSRPNTPIRHKEITPEYLTKDDFKNEVNLIFNMLLLTVLGVLASLYFSVKKNNEVTEEKTSLLGSSIQKNFEKSTEKHHKILHDTKKIVNDTRELRKISDKIDSNIQNISVNPAKYKKQLRKNLNKYKALLKITKDDIESRDIEIITFQDSMIELIYSSAEKIENLEKLIESLKELSNRNNHYLSEIHDILTSLVPINNDSIKEMVIEELREITGHKVE